MMWLMLGMAYAASGTLNVLVFGESGMPQANVELSIYGEHTEKRMISDSYGSITLEMESGAYVLERQGYAPIKVQVVADQHSEIIYSATQQIDTQIPSAAVEDAQKIPSSAAEVAFSGRVVDVDGAPIDNAVLIFRGTEIEASTNENGSFSIDLPAGVYDLVVIKNSFIERRYDTMTIDEELTLEIVMSPSGYQMDDFFITAPRIEGTSASMLAERKEASSVNDVLGTEQMARSGDSDAAAALKRITGLSVVGGKYVYVRGLGERYSASLLNGSTLPSPEPERRVVPLDLFPTALLESITIQKTFSPDQPAEFGGGMIALKTRGIPTQPSLQIAVSGGIVEGSTFQSGLSGFENGSDWTSYGSRSRRLPTEVQEASNKSPLEETDMFSSRGYTASELESLGERMPNHWSLHEQKARPKMGVSVSGGRGWDIRGAQLGVWGAALWKEGWDFNSFDRNYYLVGENDQLEKSHTYRFDNLSHSAKVGAAVVTSLEWSEHSIQSTSLFNRSSDLTTRTYTGYNRDVATDIEVTRIGWKERALFFQQFAGQHPLPSDQNLRIEWRYAYSKANRQEPDRREFRYDLEEGSNVWYLSDRPEGNSIFYSELLDNNHDATLQLIKPLSIGNTSRQSEFKSGIGGVIRRRGVDTRRYKYMHKGSMSYDPDILSSPPADVFVSDHIGSDGFQFEEVTRQTDNYSARQEIWSAFSMIDAKLMKRISILTGARMEASFQNVETFELFNPDQQPVMATLENTDILPACTMSFDVGQPMMPEMMKVRLGYGRTVSRPDFRELSPATFNDVTGGRQVFGNPDLKRALIDNIDLRWEWYPNAGESLSIGGFYKQFHQPIESIIVVSAQHSVTYQNADSAINKGIEVDFRKSFAFVSPLLEELYLSGNASWIHSRVALSENAGIQTSNERPLEGQSPYIYNLQLGYASLDSSWGLSGLYNVFGPRITEVGALGAPDYVELPIHRLDLVGFVGIGSMQLRLKSGNLLNSPVRIMTGTEMVEEQLMGRSLDVQLRWNK